ncbi:multidrug DMT transporter permease [Siphonobacter sp. BAB-5405]|uniref:GRP family sugar transporter n=1 Tax=Siphonobacter sp. BAB-5405 TaxID=1864825 RepID=UPI000C7FB121|nr:GRP family sugar transporter [Siphonobacter sp. BAB-5405]PMD97535.1 multidrug DMT transporter permease [Siphonobacter sp. BAB-5405]
MFIVDQPTLAVFFCLITMLCWGSWSNGQKIVTQSAPLQVFYRDYVYGIVLLSLILAFTLGSFGEEGRPFLEDIQQATLQNLALALAGGILFNIGNTLLTVGINLSGIAIAMPVGTGLSMALGIIVNYIAKPDGDLTLLAIGGGLVLVSIGMCALAYLAREEDSEEKSDNKGIWVALAGGLVSGFFFLVITSSIIEELSFPQKDKLTPYTGLVLFAFGILLSNPVLERILERLKLTGDDNETPYKEVPRREHLLGLASGLLWCVGMITLLLGSQEAGDAISYGLSQGATVVSVLWGLFAWKEFKDAPAKANRYLWLMGASYVVGLALIIMARSS